MTFSRQLEELSGTLGGCGLFQWLCCLVIDCAAVVWHWSMMQMSYFGQDVKFWCKLLRLDAQNLPYLNLTTIKVEGLCQIDKYATCRAFVFDDNMNTAVSEWALVCDKKWGIAVITTMQMIGVVAGSLSGGQSADTCGRKPTINLGLFICITLNAIGYFAISWKVYALVRFLLGFGIGLTSTVSVPLLIEYVPDWMRSTIATVPCKAIYGCLFALACWLFSDWRKVHLLTACIGLPLAFALLFAPESFRWLVIKKKFKDATHVVSVIAKVNRVAEPDLTKIFEATKSEIGKDNKAKVHTVTSLFKSIEMCSTTLRLSFIWFVISCGWYGMALGVKGLSTGIYLGIFLINVVDIPCSFATGPFVDRFGRKRFLIAVLIISGVVCCASGCLQNLKIQGLWPTSLALLGKAACTFASEGVGIYTLETYPTEIRTIGYGFCSAVGKIGTIVAPNVILLDDYVHGVLYISSGLLMFGSAFVILPLQETRNSVLKDTLSQVEVDQF